MAKQEAKTFWRAAQNLHLSPTKVAWDMFMSDNNFEEVLNCTNLEGRRTAKKVESVEALIKKNELPL